MQLKDITAIAVKDKYDVLKASDLLEFVGIPVFASAETKAKFIETGDNVKNNFLMRDSHGWRIQSHYIGDGISIEELETIITNTGPLSHIQSLVSEIEVDFIATKDKMSKLEEKLSLLKKLL